MSLEIGMILLLCRKIDSHLYRDLLSFHVSYLNFIGLGSMPFFIGFDISNNLCFLNYFSNFVDMEHYLFEYLAIVDRLTRCDISSRLFCCLLQLDGSGPPPCCPRTIVSDPSSLN